MGPGLVLDVGQSVARWPAVSHKLSFVFPSPSLSFETTGRPHFFSGALAINPVRASLLSRLVEAWLAPYALRHDPPSPGRRAAPDGLFRHGWRADARPPAVLAAASAPPQPVSDRPSLVADIALSSDQSIAGPARPGQKLLQAVRPSDCCHRQEAVHRRRLHQLQPPVPVSGELLQ